MCRRYISGTIILMFKQWTDIIKEVFPHAEILDAALNYPITDKGWDIAVPARPYECDFANPDYHLFVNLQDMLTGDELIRLNKHFVDNNFPLDRVTVIVWARNIQNSLPDKRVNVINFSSHQYEMWCSYKASEDVLRDAFDFRRKDFRYNFVCPQRIYKPHRAALYSQLSRYSHGNTSLQSKGYELQYPNLSFTEYESEYNNLINLLAMKQNYNTALFSIVSESQYDVEYGIITEKTFNSIVAGMPFLVVAHAGAVRDIQDYGFQTFGGITDGTDVWGQLFDETYDTLDNCVRIKDLITSNNSYICDKLTKDEMKNLWIDFSAICNYNRNYFFEQFGDQLISELRMDLLALWGK